MKTKRGRFSGKTPQPQTFPRGTEQIDYNGETVGHRLMCVNPGPDDLPIIVDFGKMEERIMAMEADKAKKAGVSVDKLIEAWKNFKPSLPFSYVVASVKARRRK